MHQDKRGYFCQKTRVGKRVLSEYIGTGVVAEALLAGESHQKQLKAEQRNRLNAECHALDELLDFRAACRSASIC